MFSLLTSVVTNAGFALFPQVNSQATSSLDQGSLSQFTSIQNVTSNDTSGQIGFYNLIIKSVTMTISVIVGTLVVAVPLTNLGVPWWIAYLLVQPFLYAMVVLEQTGFLRGTGVL
jgi:hypothetical protein